MIQSKALFGILLISLFLLACKNNKKVFYPTTTIIEGQMTSIQEPVITFIGTKEIKVPVDPKGKFRIDTKLEEAGVYKISFGYDELSVFLVPGDKISITGDVRNLLSGTKFTGDHKNENNFLISYENKKISSRPENFQSFYSQPENNFIEAVEKRTSELNLHQQKYEKEFGPFESNFAEIISKDLKYDEASFKLNYPIYFKYFNPETPLKLSDTYDSFLQNIDIDADESLVVPNYKHFLTNYVEYKSEIDSTTSENISNTEKKLNFIKANFQSPRVQDWLLYNLMNEALQISINEATIVIKQYNELAKNEAYKTEINDLYKKWEPLLKGKTAPEIIGKTINDDEVSLKNFSGKIIYIDVWATWCGPCLKELPHLEKLQQEFKRSDVTFVSISIDEDKTAWELMVKEKNMKGLQLLSENAWSSPLVTNYMINGIPRFILIGKDGSIIDANAPRPSSEKIKNQLSELLGT